jgi:hypothetical protein
MRALHLKEEMGVRTVVVPGAPGTRVEANP